jgi:myo-inositol-1(or 4)-monophosphatase
MRPETDAALDAVRRGLALAEAGARGHEVMAKDGRDVVTSTDIAVEDLIRERLRGLGLPVVGEERGGEAPGDGSPYWLVDPICGTRNFASGTPLYCVNLALVENGVVVMAVVGDPSRDEVVYAERGNGAWALKDGVATRLCVSDESRTVVVEDGKARGESRQRAAAFLAEVVRADRWDLRSLGTTLAMPYLAAGRIAAYGVFFVTAVHAAAGSLLVSEAGGVLTDLEGAAWTLRSRSLLFSAADALHADLLSLARS